LVSLTLLTPRPTWAEGEPAPEAASAEGEPASKASAELLVPPTPAPTPQHRLTWRYPRFRWWEYAASGAVTVGNGLLEFFYRKEVEGTWNRPILADAQVRQWLRADTPAGITRAAHASDYLWRGTTLYVLLDGLVTPLASDRFNTDVAFQLTLLNWQAIGLSGLLVRVVHVSVGRTRPSLQGCSQDPTSSNPCEFRGASFVAGHTMMTSANAGLACADHHFLPLYGGGIADALVCPVMVGSALAVGTLRIVADKHWLSDTVPSWLVGGAIGFGMPYLLHYRYVRDVLSPLPKTAIVPWVDGTSGGIGLMGQL
jgi:hypothetical protein